MSAIPIKDERRIISIKDQADNRLWSNLVDSAIEPFTDGREVMIFGAQNSLIAAGSYSGKFKVQLIDTVTSPSGTEMRNTYSDIAKVNMRLTHNQSFREGWITSTSLDTAMFHDTPDGVLMEQINKHLARDKDFREGWMAYIMSRPPRRYQSADSAIVTPNLKHVVLGEKTRDNGKKRFPGGLFDEDLDGDCSETALRKSLKECGSSLQLGAPTFICKKVIPDWRYENTGDFIETRLYLIPYLGGRLVPSSKHDLFNVKFYPIATIMSIITPAHRELAEELLRRTQ
jgi:hypothetical protein